LIHVSGNPFPILGALFIIPGVIKGAMAVSPRAKYRQQMYGVAYPNLWKKIAIQIAEDQSKRDAERMSALQKKCGIHIDEDPEIGIFWAEFASCQTRKFRLLGQEPLESGVVSVYISDDRSLRIHVANDGRIIRWYIPKKRKRLPSANIFQ